MMAPVSASVRSTPSLGVGIVVAILSFPSWVLAADFSVEAETIGQGYQLRRFGDDGSSTLLDRRRLTQYLNIQGSRFIPDEWTGPRHDKNIIYFMSSIRFDTDFGSYLTGAPTGADRIHELPRPYSLDQFQLLYAVLGGTDMAGFIDFQIGRQIVFDSMDWFSFDGLDVKIKLPYWVAVEAWAGAEVRVDAPLASPIYEIDGTSPGSRDPATCLRLATMNTMPGCPLQEDQLAPMIGAAIESWGVQWLHSRLAYRRVSSDTAGHVAGDGLPASGVDEELLSYTLAGSFGPVKPFGGVRYNLMLGMWDEIDAGIRTTLKGWSLLGEYIYNAPTFDGDSIFNVFSTYPYNDVRGTLTSPTFGAWRVWGSAFGTFFNDEYDRDKAMGQRVTSPITKGYAGGILLGTRYAPSPRGYVRFDGYYDNGFGGRKGGADLSGRYMAVPDRVELEGRVTVINFQPDLQLQNDQHATSLGLQGGVRYAMAKGVDLHVLLEENNNRYYNYQLRALALLDLTFMR
jgi:hypothetical protein